MIKKNKSNISLKKDKFTEFLYQKLAWGPLYKKADGKVIENLDNNSEKYIKKSLKIMKISPKSLKNKTVFNIGTGREAKVFAKYGALVTHLDIGKETVKEVKRWNKKTKKKIKTFSGDINDFNLGLKKFDIIFLAGVYQHLKNPAYCLIKFLNALKVNGIMYLGFYRTGEFKYFIVDTIRYLVNKKLLPKIRELNSIIYCTGHLNHYQSSRVMDDFFVPYKHNFHPRDVIHDIKKLGGEILYFDNDMREYNHESKNYFTIGGDRIYIKKKKDSLNQSSKLRNLKTTKGLNQIFDVKYKEKIINKNINLIKKIKKQYDNKFFDDDCIICLALSLYQLTRPYDLDKSLYYNESIKVGRHKKLNELLKNFVLNFDKSKNKYKLFNKTLKKHII